jgi:hypothetical protein
VAERLDDLRWSSVVEHSDEILDLFHAAIAEDVEALNTCARQVPPSTTADSTNLSPDAYRARFEAGQADARLRVVTAGLSPLYPSAHAVGDLSATHVRRMMLAEVPDRLPRERAQAVLHASLTPAWSGSPGRPCLLCGSPCWLTSA